MHFNVNTHAKYTSSACPFSTNYNLDRKLRGQRSRSPSLRLGMVHFFQANSVNVAILPLRFRGDLIQFSTTGLANDQMEGKVKGPPRGPLHTMVQSLCHSGTNRAKSGVGDFWGKRNKV